MAKSFQGAMADVWQDQIDSSNEVGMPSSLFGSDLGKLCRAVLVAAQDFARRMKAGRVYDAWANSQPLQITKSVGHTCTIVHINALV